jgi:hypothetical protein
LWLLKNGIPWNIIFGEEKLWEGEIPEAWQMAFSVIFSDFEREKNGKNRFDWQTLTFPE